MNTVQSKIFTSYLVSLNSFLFRDFANIINQLKVWVLTSDVDYLRTSSLKGFSSLIKKYKTEFQAICTSPYITDLFTNEIYVNKLRVVSEVVMPGLACADPDCAAGLPAGGDSAALPRPPRHQPAQAEVLP